MNPFCHFLSTISSYNGTGMLAALTSLLLVILFVLLLHIYALWFLSRARRRRQTSGLAVSSMARFDHSRTFYFESTSSFPSSTPSKGLDPSSICSIPFFVYGAFESGSECVICLSPLEDGVVGRRLPSCGHGFHVECIDMWLRSHSNCPLCRAPVITHTSSFKDVSSEVNSSADTPSIGIRIQGVTSDDEEAMPEIMNDAPNTELQQTLGL